MFPTQDLATAPEVSSYTLFFRTFCTNPLGQFKIINSRMSLHEMVTPVKELRDSNSHPSNGGRLKNQSF